MGNSAEERFWSYVGPADPHTGCMPYLRYKDPAGYGRFRIDKDTDMVLAHRFAFASGRSPIPPGMKVLHRCDNRPCCNPDHLFLGTQADNVRDMMEKRRNRQPQGEANANSKLTEAQIVEIRSLRGKMTQVDIGKRFNITQTSVSRIQLGDAWIDPTMPRRTKIAGQWPKGDDHGTSKLTQAKADEIRALKGKFLLREIADLYGVSTSRVGAIHRGKAWVKA